MFALYLPTRLNVLTIEDTDRSAIARLHRNMLAVVRNSWKKCQHVTQEYVGSGEKYLEEWQNVTQEHVGSGAFYLEEMSGWYRQPISCLMHIHYTSFQGRLGLPYIQSIRHRRCPGERQLISTHWCMRRFVFIRFQNSFVFCRCTDCIMMIPQRMCTETSATLRGILHKTSPVGDAVIALFISAGPVQPLCFSSVKFLWRVVMKI